MRFSRHADLRRLRRDEVLDQQGQILGPLAQRRQMQRHDVQTIVEIRTERAVSHRLLEIAIGGRDDPHVDVDALLAADTHELALLDHPQELRLQRRRELADLVQEDRALIRELELAELPL